MALLFWIGKSKQSKLRAAYPYGLNNWIENIDWCKLGKEYEDLIGKAFPSLPHIMQRDNNARHQNRKGQISLNHKYFNSQFEHYLKHGILLHDMLLIKLESLH